MTCKRHFATLASSDGLGTRGSAPNPGSAPVLASDCADKDDLDTLLGVHSYQQRPCCIVPQLLLLMLPPLHYQHPRCKDKTPLCAGAGRFLSKRSPTGRTTLCTRPFCSDFHVEGLGYNIPGGPKK